MAFKVGIIILSDTCFKDKSQDKTTPAIVEFTQSINAELGLDGSPVYEIAKTAIVPDKIDEIQNIISQWTKSTIPDELSLILTCGGTGFTIHDVTPEAIRPLLEKEAPGIVHLMLSESLKITPFAIMSRPIAGIRNKSLIITLPGSPKGSTENLNSIIRTLPHALAQIGNKDARALHKKMNRTLKDAMPNTPAHHHGEDKVTGRIGCGISRHVLISNDLNAPVTQRARESPYPIISIDSAFGLISSNTPNPTIIEIDINDPLFTGSYLAEDIYSPLNHPNFRASIVDGYAVISSDGPGVYPIVSISHASSLNKESKLTKGCISRVTTGAPVPLGADAVVMVEETQLITLTNDGDEEKEVRILATDVKPNENIREIGSDLKKGELILSKGSRISNTGGDIGLLASVGVKKVKVYKKPLLAVLSTGDELKDLIKDDEAGELRYGEIYDSNRPTLISAIKSTGYKSIDLGIATDKKNELASLLIKAFEEEEADYLITTGGVSMGELDLLKPTIERVLKGTIHFGRVRMKPGKPTTFATVEINGKTKIIFALPGNPASATVCYYLFVLPSLLKFQGAPTSSGSVLPLLPKLKVKLNGDYKLDPKRPEYQRVLVYQNDKFELVAESTGFQRSSRIGSFKGANGLACLPASCDLGGAKALKDGEFVDVILIGQLFSTL